MTKGEKIKDKARDLGFELVGFAPALPVPDWDFFRWWLDQGYAATMSYLNRGAERRRDPSKILPGVRSLICVGLNYYTESPGDEIARYAHGRDYHQVVLEKLQTLEEFIQNEIDPSAQTKSYVDTGAILERSYAARAGLGWIGKNTMLINEGLGSFFFIGEILTTLEFDDTDYGRPALDQCGTCTKCLDGCPTGALVEPGVLDSNKCVSYLTIEYKGVFSADQEKMTDKHLYGCDICQDVCPYNDRIPVTPLAAFQPRSNLPNEVVDLSAVEFQRLIDGSAMERIRYDQWVRNVRAARGKSR